MGDEVTRRTLQRFNEAERKAVHYHTGTVTIAVPLAVLLGGSVTALTSVKHLSSYSPVVGDVVGAISFGNDMLVLGKIGAEARQAFSFSNGWRAYQGGTGGAGSFGTSVGYFKDSNGVVHLEGLIDKNGGNWVGAETILTLPAGYRPPSSRMFTVRAASGGGVEVVGRVDINTSGVMSMQVGGANPVGYLVLDGITFRAF